MGKRNFFVASAKQPGRWCGSTHKAQKRTRHCEPVRTLVRNDVLVFTRSSTYLLHPKQQPGRAGVRWTAPPGDGCPCGKKRVVGTPLPGCPNGPVGKNLRRGSAHRFPRGEGIKGAKNTPRQWRVFADCQKTPNTGEANSFPRGEGGPRRGSEEEFGQKLESLHNQKTY